MLIWQKNIFKRWHNCFANRIYISFVFHQQILLPILLPMQFYIIIGNKLILKYFYKVFFYLLKYKKANILRLFSFLSIFILSHLFMNNITNIGLDTLNLVEQSIVEKELKSSFF